MINGHHDAAVVGAGIVGLAHAYQLAKRGLKVVVLERGERAAGASVRNFGMIWPVGQPFGLMREMALRSREIWLELLREAGLWHEPTGSLHLAYREDEERVLTEFAALAAERDVDWSLIGPDEVRDRAPLVRTEGLRVALWSPTEMCVDPREVISALPSFLASRYGVRFEFGRAVVGFDRPRVRVGESGLTAGRLFVCSGDDFGTLYPSVLESSGLIRCKLQMMRTEPVGNGFRLGPMLAGGLTLRHYRSFEGCPSLSALKARIAQETPQFDRYGIHVMASQNGRGELVLGDSHEYGMSIEPFDKEEIDRMILDYLRGFLDMSGLRIASRWHGTYAKHPEAPFYLARPEPGVTVVTGMGGAGMTLSLGLAERVVRDELGEGQNT